MASDKKRSRHLFEPNDKQTIRIKESGEAGMVAFRARLTEEETNVLAEMKSSDPDLCSGWNDVFLMRFLWARKLDVSRAKEMLKTHLAWREEWNIEELDLESVKAHYRRGNHLWCPGHYTKEGNNVSYVFARHHNPDEMGLIGMRGLLHGFYFNLDVALDHDLDNARKGTLVIQDFTDASFKTVMRMIRPDNGLDMKKWMSSIQECMPSRVAGVLILNAPWYIRLVTSAIKPLMKPKLRKRIKICSNSDLDEYFTPEQLPTIYGGQFNLKEEWAETLIEARPHLSEGKYIDPSPKSKAFLASCSGVQLDSSSEDTPCEVKPKKKSKKSKKREPEE